MIPPSRNPQLDVPCAIFSASSGPTPLPSTELMFSPEDVIIPEAHPAVLRVLSSSIYLVRHQLSGLFAISNPASFSVPMRSLLSRCRSYHPLSSALPDVPG